MTDPRNGGGAVTRREFVVGAAGALAAAGFGGRHRRVWADPGHLLIPMDDSQQNHLKAYGLTYNALHDGLRGEWLLNYRGGSFLLPALPDLARRAALDGISTTALDDGAVAAMRAEIAGANMDSVPLEKAPTVAIYKPPTSPPWDDAVTLAVKYAGIPFTQVWDDEVLAGDLSKYDWVHLHHEDFTGQFNKLYLSYRGAPWFIEEVQRDMATAQRHGFTTVPALKKAVAEGIREFRRTRRPALRDVRRHRNARSRDRRRGTSTSPVCSPTELRWTRRPTRRWTGRARWRSAAPSSRRHPASIR